MAYRVSDNVGHRTDKPFEAPVNPVEYEKQIYQEGLRFQRPPFTFQTGQWQVEAEKRMSAESRGYVVGNAGTGETAAKNLAAFKKWSIVSTPINGALPLNKVNMC
jgi:hypothetical protein